MKIIDQLTEKLIARVPEALPSACPVQPPGTGGISTFMGWLAWGGLALCIAGVIVGGLMLWRDSRKGESNEGLNKILLACLGAVVIGMASSLIGFLSNSSGC